MEILQLLINQFLDENKAKALQPFLKLLSENNFDIKRVLKNINPQMLASVFSSAFKNQNRATNVARYSYGVEPISNIANKEVVFALNKYFGSR